MVHFRLVDWTGCQIREDKGGRIEDDHPAIFNQLVIFPRNLCLYPEADSAPCVDFAVSLSLSFPQKRRETFAYYAHYAKDLAKSYRDISQVTRW